LWVGLGFFLSCKCAGLKQKLLHTSYPQQAITFPHTVDFSLNPYLNIPEQVRVHKTFCLRKLVHLLHPCLSIYRRIHFPLLLQNTANAIGRNVLPLKGVTVIAGDAHSLGVL